jgi:hypothetical protein
MNGSPEVFNADELRSLLAQLPRLGSEVAEPRLQLRVVTPQATIIALEWNNNLAWDSDDPLLGFIGYEGDKAKDQRYHSFHTLDDGLLYVWQCPSEEGMDAGEEGLDFGPVTHIALERAE